MLSALYDGEYQDGGEAGDKTVGKIGYSKRHINYATWVNKSDFLKMHQWLLIQTLQSNSLWQTFTKCDPIAIIQTFGRFSSSV